MGSKPSSSTCYKKPSSDDDRNLTKQAIATIENEILAFHGFRWSNIEVFWTPWNAKDLTNALRGRDITTGDGSSTFLEPSRPPDWMGMPKLSYSHMGVILTAVSKSPSSYDKLCHLYVAVQLLPYGIELKHVYGYPAALSEFKERLLNIASTLAVFSAWGLGSRWM